MVEQYYVDQVTRLSQQELQQVFQAAEPPVALLGGWAVHLHVNTGFQSTHQREYIGSRDIDIGLHIQPGWTPGQVRDSSAGQTLAKIEELGYNRSRFGFVQHFDRDNGERLTEEEASNRPMHEVFQVYVDTIPNTTELDNFEAEFGFRPPAETVLQPVFDDDQGEPLQDYVDWDVPKSAVIAPPELLAAMKIRSLPDRDKSHKQVKDTADLHALLWHVTDYNQIKSQVLGHVTDEDLEALNQALQQPLFENAANLLQTDTTLVKDTINQLTQ